MSSVEQLIQLLREQSRTGLLPDHVAKMALTPTTTLADLGIDSLGKMSLLTGLMDLTDEYFSDDAFNDNDTLGDIALKVLGSS